MKKLVLLILVSVFLIFVCASGDGSLTSVHSEKMVDIDEYRKRIDIIVKK